MDKKYDSPIEPDASLAAKLQAQEDAHLAQLLEDERVASTLDPWTAAEQEWAEVEKKQHIDNDGKLARKLASNEEVKVKARDTSIELDRKLAEQLLKEEQEKTKANQKK